MDEGADILIVESDSVKGPVFDLPLKLIGSCRGDPNNVDVAAATKAGIPVLRAPGRNADAVAEITIALLFAANRFIVPADHDVRADQVYAGGKIPYQRYRAWQLAGRTAGIVGLGAVGPRREVAVRGLGMRVLSFDPYNPEATHHTPTELDGDARRVRRRVDARDGHARDRRPDRRGAVRGDEAGLRSTSTRPARCCTTPTRSSPSLQSGHLGGAGLDHFEGEHLAHRPPAVAMHNVVLTPHIGGRDLRHRSEPLEAHRRRRRRASCAARSR